MMEGCNTLPPLVVILGYNGIGKSHLASEVAQRFNGEIVSADSRQVYRHLDIGTAKVTPEEQRSVRHHLIDVAEPMESVTLADYQRLANEVIDDIHRRGKLPVMVGGTGLYIWAIVDNLLIPPCPPDEEMRKELEAHETDQLVAMLKEFDPISAAKEDLIANRRRLIRALEVCLKLGVPFSQVRGKGKPKYNVLQIGLTMPFNKLFERIDRRVDLRFEMGMVDEVKALLRMGVTHERLESLGMEYCCISRYLRGEIKTLAETATQLKRSIHQYTRRQKTWFKRDRRVVWVDVDYCLRDNVFILIEEFLASR